jgi:hypothetical protein
LKSKCEQALSNFAFNFNLRRYNEANPEHDNNHVTTVAGTGHPGRGLHSSTYLLNLSRFRN